MEWNVKNALSRDVEREHLNKILKEIRAAMDSSSGSQLTEAEIRAIILEIINANAGNSGVTFSIALTGDVTGSGTVVNSNNVSITTTLAEDYVEEAPLDSNIYWRSGGAWAAVPGILRSLSLIEDEGLLAYTEEEGWVVREIEGTAGEIEVTDGDAIAGNPTIGLADTAVTPGTYGSATEAVVITVDQKGRLTAVTVEEIEGGGGGIETIVEGTGIEVDATDPENPIVGLDAATQASLALADSAIQAGDLGSAAYADTTDFATAAQGALADTALQPGEAEPPFTKGSIVAGTNVSITGTVTDRLVGAGNITISATNNYGISFTAGENIDAGDFVYVFSDGMVYKADNSSPDTAAVGFAPASITSAASGLILVNGLNAAMSSLTPGVTYALDLTGGVTTLDLLPTTPGTIIQVLGVGITVSSMMVDIQPAILRG